MIRLQKINKYYGMNECKHKVLNDVNIHIEKGEMVSVMGPSGSGKSTMLNILGLLDNEYEGKYLLDNIDVSNMNEEERARLRSEKIGFVFQSFHLLKDLTALENVKMGLIISNTVKKRQKLKKSEMIKKSIDMLKLMGLESQINQKTNRLSGGQQQRVAIARALINEPSIILADEPTGALDQKTGDEIMCILKELNRKGKTIIIVTHDEKVSDYCSRKLHIVDGFFCNKDTNKGDF